MTSGAKLTRRLPDFRLVARILAASLALSLAIPLAGCVEQAAELDASAGAPASAQARAQTAPRATTAAFTRLEGAPQPVIDRFIRSLAAEAKGHDITPVEPEAAKYLVHGYLSASKTTNGATLGYVWDVFDSRKARIQRIEDRIAVQGSGADPWTLADDKALGQLAAKSAEDLAAVLSAMPDAGAGAR